MFKKNEEFAYLLPWLENSYKKIIKSYRNKTLPQSLIISGLPDTGRRNLAFVLSTSLFLDYDFYPKSMDVNSYTEFLELLNTNIDHHPDLYWVHPHEKKTISIDQIRNFIKDIHLKSHQGGNKVVIIDTADLLTAQSTNSILKTLEEPPDDTYILLISSNIGSLLPTVRSRCQVIQVPTPRIIDSVDWLKSSPSSFDDKSWSVLLNICDFLPLRAIRMESSPLLERFNKAIDKLKRVYNGEVALQDIVTEIVNNDFEDFLTWLIIALKLDIKNDFNLKDEHSQNVFDAFNPLFKSLTTKKKLQQLDLVEYLKKNLNSGLNKEVALRNILLQFSR